MDGAGDRCDDLVVVKRLDPVALVDEGRVDFLGLFDRRVQLVETLIVANDLLGLGDGGKPRAGIGGAGRPGDGVLHRLLLAKWLRSDLCRLCRACIALAGRLYPGCATHGAAVVYLMRG